MIVAHTRPEAEQVRLGFFACDLGGLMLPRTKEVLKVASNLETLRRSLVDSAMAQPGHINQVMQLVANKKLRDDG